MIGVAGISHHTAPIAVRERYAVSADALPDVLHGLRDRYGAALVLSTCNRTELYLSHPGALSDAEELRQALSGLRQDANADTSCLYVYSGADAARHLFRVASGLDSMVLGEDQILSQVRIAFAAAATAGSSDRLLSRLFHLAIATGRRVRGQTNIGRYARSVSTAAVEAARTRIPCLGNASVLVLGAGEAGKLTARSLRDAGAGRLLLFNRTHSRATRLADVVGGEAVTQSGFLAALGTADVVIGASAAPDYQLTAAMVRQARALEPAKQLLILDIAVPRDVEPAVADEPRVTLIDIDGLRGDVRDVSTLDDLARAEAIVDEEVSRLAEWWETLRVVPTISALRERAEAIRQAELARSLGRLRDLTPDERSRVDALTSAIVNKMLHHPIARLKQPGSGERYAAVVHELFDLPQAASE